MQLSILIEAYNHCALFSQHPNADRVNKWILDCYSLKVILETALKADRKDEQSSLREEPIEQMISLLDSNENLEDAIGNLDKLSQMAELLPRDLMK